MSKAGPSFQYSPLKSGEIRLLNPRLDDPGNLTWELNSVPLLNNEGTGKPTAPGDYDALPYAWGNPEDQTFPITCNDQTIMVCSPPRQIWIDAVYMNQSDGLEKMEQIGRMADLYRTANEVVVWLGPGRGKDHIDTAIALIPLLAQLGKAAIVYVMNPLQPEPDFPDTAMPEASSPVWNVLSDIASHQCTVEFDALQDLLDFMIAVIQGNVTNLGPGVKIFQKEGAKHGINFGISPLQEPSRATPIPFLAPQTSVSQDAEDDQLLTGLFLTTMSQRCEKPHDRVVGVLGLTEAKAEIKALGLEVGA
ncbi:hypothetical protein F5883DRAFT_643257 [Diaporthe sp. PMI_573]|nr:hypothetical protein F5883DRAFT_643257 [Diaporthaceae sp. PMI_573]